MGTRAVYLSATDSGAGKEVTARNARLGGAQITPDKYPRIVYTVTVDLNRTLELDGLGSTSAGLAVKNASLDPDDLTASMELAKLLEAEGIEGLLFPSVVGGDDNLVVYRSQSRRSALTIENEQQFIDQVKRLAGKQRDQR